MPDQPDLDELDRLYAAASPDAKLIAALHNAWPAISRELRALRLLAADAVNHPLDTE